MTPQATKPIELIIRQQKLWDEFVKLTAKVHQTLDLEDGIAAGRAYRAFMNDFLDVETREKLEATEFPNRGAKV